MRACTWLRMPWDVLFSLGALAVILFTFKAVGGVWGWRSAEEAVKAPAPNAEPVLSFRASED